MQLEKQIQDLLYHQFIVKTELMKIQYESKNITPVKLAMSSQQHENLTPLKERQQLSYRGQAFITPPPQSYNFKHTPLYRQTQHQQTTSQFTQDTDLTPPKIEPDEMTPIQPMFSSARIGFMKQIIQEHKKQQKSNQSSPQDSLANRITNKQNDIPLVQIIDDYNVDVLNDSSMANPEEIKQDIEDVKKSLIKVKEAEMKVYQELERKKNKQMFNLDSAYNEFIQNKIQSIALKNSPGLSNDLMQTEHSQFLQKRRSLAVVSEKESRLGCDGNSSPQNTESKMPTSNLHSFSFQNQDMRMSPVGFQQQESIQDSLRQSSKDKLKNRVLEIANTNKSNLNSNHLLSNIYSQKLNRANKPKNQQPQMMFATSPKYEALISRPQQDQLVNLVIKKQDEATITGITPEKPQKIKSSLIEKAGLPLDIHDSKKGTVNRRASITHQENRIKKAQTPMEGQVIKRQTQIRPSNTGTGNAGSRQNSLKKKYENNQELNRIKMKGKVQNAIPKIRVHLPRNQMYQTLDGSKELTQSFKIGSAQTLSNTILSHDSHQTVTIKSGKLSKFLNSNDHNTKSTILPKDPQPLQQIRQKRLIRHQQPNKQTTTQQSNSPQRQGSCHDRCKEQALQLSASKILSRETSNQRHADQSKAIEINHKFTDEPRQTSKQRFDRNTKRLLQSSKSERTIDIHFHKRNTNHTPQQTTQESNPSIIKMDVGYWLNQYQEKLQKFIITSPSKNLKEKLQVSGSVYLTDETLEGKGVKTQREAFQIPYQWTYHTITED